MWLLILLLFTNMKAQTEKIDPVITIINAKSMVKFTGEEKKELTQWFRFYGKKWRVDPVLSACIAASESNFRASPPPCVYCKTKIVNGSAVEDCKPRRKEVGMMQSLHYQKVTRLGYWLCTGKPWNRSRMKNRRISICVGSFELTNRRWWVRKNKRWIRARNKRHKRFLYKIRKKYPNKYKYLKEMFWTAGTYNWGPRILRRNKRKRYDNIGYPIRVMRCYLRYSNGRQTNKAVAKTPERNLGSASGSRTNLRGSPK
jgi:hypothetical protein